MASLLVNRRDILEKLGEIRTIGLVGASSNPGRSSYQVMAFLLQRGFEVIPVNPGQAGKEILGKTVSATLADIDHPIDMVDVFRNSAVVPAIVEEILRLPVLPGLLWLQLGIVHEEAARHAIAAGIDVVMDQCPAIELGGSHHN